MVNIRQVTYNGRKMSATDFAIEIGMKPDTVRKKLIKGFTVDEIVNKTRKAYTKVMPTKESIEDNNQFVFENSINKRFKYSRII